MNKKYIYKNIVTILFAFLIFNINASCSDDNDLGGYKLVEETDETKKPPSTDDTDPSLKEIVSIDPLWNPDRGLHLESIYQVTNTAGRIINPYKSTTEIYPVGFMDTRNTEFDSKNDAVSITQLYIYLTDWYQKDEISKEGLDNIQLLFDGLKEKNVKAILRFAYKNDKGGDNPGVERTLKHIEQLKPILKRNWGVITCIQSGFIGMWGEWGGSAYDTPSNNKVMNALLKVIPKDYYMEIRRPPYKNSLKPDLEDPTDYDRIGYNNDYFTVGLHPMAPGNDYIPGDDQYRQVAQEAYTLYISGEIPYNEGPPWGFDKLMNPDVVLVVLKTHHYSAMDITQNYTDNITYWKTVKIYPEKLRKINIFFDEHYFMEGNGEVVPRSLYQFIRDHLGYRLNVEEAKLNASGGNLEYDIKIKNTGFATVLNPKKVSIVFIDSQNNTIAKEIPLSDINPKEWQPYAKGEKDIQITHTISGSVSAGLSGTFKVGVWVSDAVENIAKVSAAYDVKFAIDNKKVSHWTDESKTRTVNIVGEVSF